MEANEILLIGRRNRSVINAMLFEKRMKTFSIAFREFGEAHSGVAIRGVYKNLIASFGVSKKNFSDIRYLFFEGVDDRKSDEVMTSRQRA